MLFEDIAQNSSPSFNPGPDTFYHLFLSASVLELKTFFHFPTYIYYIRDIPSSCLQIV